MIVYITRLGAVSLAYALAGWLSLQLSVPPGYAAPFFPSAGIALSAMLLFGTSIWPAIFIGSLAVNVYASIQSGFPDAVRWTIALTACGAVLQAMIGAWMVHRLVGFPNPLDAPRPIIRFLAIVAPLSSLINPCISIPALHLTGAMGSAEVALSWWAWWLGDTIGVIIAAPLMFVFFARPAEDWRSRRVGIIVPLAIAGILLAFAFYSAGNWEALRVQTQFNRDAEHIASSVRKRMEVQIDMLLSIERLFAVSQNVTRTEFHDFVTPWLQRYPGTQNFGWNPLVRNDERTDFEERIRKSGMPNFRILGRNVAGETFPAPEAAEYFPITYVEPLETNLKALGLNPASLRTTAETIQRAIKMGVPVVSEAIRLVQEDSLQRGVVVYLPSFGAIDPASGQKSLRGIVSGAYRMDDSIASTYELARKSGIELCLIDADAPLDNRRLSGAPDCDSDKWLSKAITQSIPIRFAERNWVLRLGSTPEYMQAVLSWTAWSTAATGMLAVGVLGAFLLMTTGNTRRIRALVERRTAELQTATDQLKGQQDALAVAQRIARLGSWEIEAGSSKLHTSDELKQILQREGASLATQGDLVASVADTDRDRLTRAIARISKVPGRVSFDCRLAANGNTVVEFQIESEWQNKRLHRIRGTVQDVSAEREAEAHIQYLAHFDPLTGLPNRSAWTNQAQAALVSAHRNNDVLGVLFLDLDNFKTVNDSLGHPVGDRLLSAVARRLGSCLREEDVLARIGGDEFVVLLPRLQHPDEAALVARKLIQMLSTPIQIEGHELSTSVSIGIALYPEDGHDVDTLLKHADTAMYGAKAGGRNQYEFFVPEMNARAFERLMLESALRRAIERNELTLHYQPQVDAGSGLINGCEALVRWQHPDLGLVPPAQFIPVAEESGLIIPLGDWVLREACRQQAHWQKTGMGDVLVAINISALQFLKPDFVTHVREALANAGANPHRIELEITESALMQASSAITERLHALRDMGLTLALDDFGTGYSSLAYLKRLPIRRLKIDRSFVKDLPGDAEDAAVASATLSLARDLGLEVVAEGVETELQRDYLLERGCDSLQGFLFSRPLPVEDFEDWFSLNQTSD